MVRLKTKRNLGIIKRSKTKVTILYNAKESEKKTLKVLYINAKEQ